MNFLKKIISFFLILNIFLGINITNADSDSRTFTYNTTSTINRTLYKDLILVKNQLEETQNGKNHVKQIDTLIEKYENNEEILNKLEERTNTLVEELENNDSKEYAYIKLLSNYINLKVKITRIALEEENKAIIIEQIEEKKEEMLNSTLSDSENEIVNEKLVDIQLNLFEKGINKIKAITEEFEKLSNYEESGNFNMNFNISEDSIGMFDAGLTISDYISKTNNFDSQISGQVEGYFIQNSGEEEENLNISSFIDFISKDGNIYVLLQDLNISEENLDITEEWIEKVKTIAEENKYIKFEDNSSKQMLNVLKSLNLNNILDDGKNTLNEPMFKAYKKEGDKYYLVPTQYACSKAKEFLNKFDPFFGNTCTQNQYEGMLEDLAEFGDIYMIIGNNTTIGFELIENDDFEQFDGYITFSDTNIEELSIDIKPNQDRNPNEFLSIDYIRNEKLDFNFYAEEGDINYKFISTLDSNNKFISIDYSGQTISNYDEFYSNLTLENKKITGDFTFYPGKYDWQTRKYIRDNKISGTISGNTSYSNVLRNIKLEYTGSNNDDGEYLNGSIGYENSRFSFINNITKEGLMSEFELTFDWDSDEKIISYLDFSGVIKIKQMEYDYENYQITYTGEFQEIFNTNITLDYKEISGQTIISNDGEEVINITHSGNSEKNYFVLNNTFEISEEVFNSLFGYSADARNSKRRMDISNLASSINIKLTTGESLENMIIRNTEYEGDNLSIGDTELTAGENYFVGTPNYDIIGISKEWFLDPDDSEYIIGGVITDNDEYFEIYAKMEDGENYVAKIYTNSYYGEEDIEGLISIDGEIIQEGDIMGDNPDYKEYTNTGGNFNIELDTRDNKNNSDIYFDFSANDENIIKFELNNDSTIEYKDIEINEPDEEDTINAEDVFEDYYDDYYYY